MSKTQIITSENLISRMILDQADSSQALKELVQNAIDSEASRVNIDATPTYILFQENGKGMSREEFMKYFRVLGESSKDESSNQTIGKFGIGLGQIFALGKCLFYFKTDTEEQMFYIDFQNLHVNIYDISEEQFNLALKGNQIQLDEHEITLFDYLELDRLRWAKNSTQTGSAVLIHRYNNIGGYELERELSYFQHTNLVYPRCEIEVNTQILSSEYTYETDLAFYYFTNKIYYMYFYERGIKVKQLNMFNCLGGYIVSKIPIKLNYTRTDIKEEDTNYTNILKEANEYVIKFLKDSTYLSDHNRDDIKKIIFNYPTLLKQVKTLKLFKNTSGKYYSYNQLKSRKIIEAEEGDFIADKLNQQGLTIAFNTIDYDILKSLNIEVVYNELKDEAIRQNINIDKEELSIEEYCNTQKILYFTELRNWGIVSDINRVVFNTNRSLLLCKGGAVQGYTDGYYKIAINVNFLQIKDLREAILKIFELLLHEYSHDNNSLRTNIHSQEFYERYNQLFNDRLQSLSYIFSYKQKDFINNEIYESYKSKIKKYRQNKTK